MKLFVFLAAVATLSAQTVTVTGSHVENANSQPITGTIYFQPTALNGTPLGFRNVTRGQVTPQTVWTPITNGAFSMTIADTSQSQPANVCYRVWANNPQGITVLGSATGATPGYTCVQVSPTWCSGGVCNFDSYTPNAAPLAIVQTGPTGATGPPGAAGGAAKVNGISPDGSGNIALASTNLSDTATLMRTTTAVQASQVSGIASTNLSDTASLMRTTTAVSNSQLPTTDRGRTCEVHIWGDGTSGALQTSDSEVNSCYNDSASTLTITGVRCLADNSSTTTSITPIVTGGSSTSLLSGALTCGSGTFVSGTLNGTPTLASGGSNDVNITAAGTAKSLRVIISGTF